MADYVLSCCGTADLSLDYYKEKNISYVPYHFSIDGVEYEDDFGKTISYHDFYEKMKNGSSTKTSQVTAGEFTNYFEKFLMEGKDILHLTLSAGISGVYNSACSAASQLREKYPDRKIIVINSVSGSSGLGLLMDKLADLKAAGMNIDELAKYAEDRKLEVHHWFFSSNLDFYVKGGRIKKSSAFVASLLHICPVLELSGKGEIVVKEKAITAKMAISHLIKKMKLYAENQEQYSGKVFICHAESENYANSLKEKVLSTFPNVKEENIKIFPVGTTIGSHTGPGTAGLFFFGKPREVK